MNVPKGNAVALQALKPIENKTADILSGYVFELIKQKKADDAARAKQIADSNKTWFDAYKDLKVDPTVTAKMYQDTSNKLFLETKDLISKAGMLSQDPNLSEQEKIKMYNVAQNAQTQYNMFRSTLQNEKALSEYYKGNEDIANGTAFQLSDDIAFRAMIDSHSFETKLDENGNIIIRGAKSPLSNEYKDYTLGEAVALMSKRPEKDLLNGKGGFLDQLFNDAEKMKQSWSSDTTGFKTTSWTKFSEENGGKYFDTVFGEYSPNYIDPRLKQYARQILQKDIESKKDFDELKKSVINYMSTAVPTSSKVDVARPTVVNVNNGSGSGNGSGENEPIISSSVLKLYNADKSGKKDTRFYNADGVMMKGSAKYNEFGVTGNQKSREVFVQSYWNPNGKNANGGKGSIAYGLVMPVQGGSFVMRPLSSKEDPSGAKSVQKYFTNAEFSKFNNKTREYFSNPENRNGYKFNPNVDKTLYGDETLFTDLLPSLGNTVRQSNRTQQ